MYGVAQITIWQIFFVFRMMMTMTDIYVLEAWNLQRHRDGIPFPKVN